MYLQESQRKPRGPNRGDQLILLCPGLCQFQPGRPAAQGPPPSQAAGAAGPPALGHLSEAAFAWGGGQHSGAWAGRGAMCLAPRSQRVALGRSRCVQRVENHPSNRSRDGRLDRSAGPREGAEAPRAVVRMFTGCAGFLGSSLLHGCPLMAKSHSVLCARALVSSQVPISHPQVAGRAASSPPPRCQRLHFGAGCGSHGAPPFLPGGA